MSATDVAAWVAALATFTAALFAGMEFRRLRLQERSAERATIEGVVVAWEPDVAPSQPESHGLATWTYTFTAHNPGALPIRDVVVTVRFPTPVRRVHTGPHGPLHVDDESESLVMRTPVLIGGRDRTWHRTVRMQFDARARLPQTTAEISFVDMKGEPHVNRWSAVRSDHAETA